MNVSVHKKSGETGELLPATRVELKNINSFNAILRATDGEIVRQKKLLHAAERVVHETRTYDQARNESTSLRSKEDQYDYRFMPEANLLPLFVYPSRTFQPDRDSFTCVHNPQLVFDKYYLEWIDSHLKSKPQCFVDLDKVSTVYLRPSFLFDLPLTYLDVQNR